MAGFTLARIGDDECWRIVLEQDKLKKILDFDGDYALFEAYPELREGATLNTVVQNPQTRPGRASRVMIITIMRVC